MNEFIAGSSDAVDRSNVAYSAGLLRTSSKQDPLTQHAHPGVAFAPYSEDNCKQLYLLTRPNTFAPYRQAYCKQLTPDAAKLTNPRCGDSPVQCWSTAIVGSSDAAYRSGNSTVQ
jgi:hypothetical protein